jgi:hypothetical protein
MWLDFIRTFSEKCIVTNNFYKQTLDMQRTAGITTSLYD